MLLRCLQAYNPRLSSFIFKYVFYSLRSNVSALKPLKYLLVRVGAKGLSFHCFREAFESFSWYLKAVTQWLMLFVKSQQKSFDANSQSQITLPPISCIYHTYMHLPSCNEKQSIYKVVLTNKNVAVFCTSSLKSWSTGLLSSGAVLPNAPGHQLTPSPLVSFPPMAQMGRNNL